ncbi:hypothetical protein FSP39_001306 [Pinctada imbricata]|uniref:IRS-type PTB domain-containing protein n=1 Tax=Pinctada imbricata TaxID=66713 RepID=A0AA89BLA5_PINIB|nr:hypothetical protein FSP39_001306 [Pinctada imbricata]
MNEASTEPNETSTSDTTQNDAPSSTSTNVSTGEKTEEIQTKEKTEETRTAEQEVTLNKADMICSLTDGMSDKSDDEKAGGAETMEMNVIADHKNEEANKKVNDFEVEMNYTPDSDRVGLEGEYVLHFSTDVLQLMDTFDEVVATWNYRHLRRVGYNKIQSKFIIDAGRKCGEFKGVFDFNVNDDPLAIIKAMEDKQGCNLKLAEKTARISTFIY